MDLPAVPATKAKGNHSVDRQSICSSTSNEPISKANRDHSEDEQSQHSILSDNDDEQQHDVKRIKKESDHVHFLPPAPPSAAAFSPSMYFPSPFFSHPAMFPSFLNPSLLLQSKMNYSSRLPNLPMNPSLEFFKQASAFVQQSASPNSSRSSSSSSPRPSSPLQQQQQQQRMHAVAAMMAAAQGNSHPHQHSPHVRPVVAPTPTQQRRVEKEERNFQCRWCDYRGRWRSELIQHMRCHHARDKPYHCSACPYASSWKWDVQVSICLSVASHWSPTLPI